MISTTQHCLRITSLPSFHEYLDCFLRVQHLCRIFPFVIKVLVRLFNAERTASFACDHLDKVVFANLFILHHCINPGVGDVVRYGPENVRDFPDPTCQHVEEASFYALVIPQIAEWDPFRDRSSLDASLSLLQRGRVPR